MNTRRFRWMGWNAVIALLMVFAGPEKSSSADDVAWDKIERGLLYARIEVDPLCGKRMTVVHIYNIDASRFALKPVNHGDLAASVPLTFDEWYRRTDAPIIFNVFSREETEKPAGYLRISGETLNDKIDNRWKGFLIMDPPGGSKPFTRIIDTNLESFQPDRSVFRTVIQRPMLVDETRQARVEPRNLRVMRVVLGEDENRNLLVFVPEGSCTMWEIAQWLPKSPVPVKRAMVIGSGDRPQVLGRFAPERIYVRAYPSVPGTNPPKGSGGAGTSASERPARVLAVLPIPEH